MNEDLNILLCAPRGFCAGVDRAVEIVEKSLQKFGAPIYVRHEIVHNKHVVQNLENKGVIFVDELDEIDEISSKLDCPTRGWTAQNDELSNLSIFCIFHRFYSSIIVVISIFL